MGRHGSGNNCLGNCSNRMQACIRLEMSKCAKGSMALQRVGSELKDARVEAFLSGWPPGLLCARGQKKLSVRPCLVHWYTQVQDDQDVIHTALGCAVCGENSRILLKTLLLTTCQPCSSALPWPQHGSAAYAIELLRQLHDHECHQWVYSLEVPLTSQLAGADVPIHLPCIYDS